MYSFIERVRKRKHHERKAIALSIAGGVTAIIAVVWFATLPLRAPTLFGGQTQGATTAQVVNTPYKIPSDSLFVAAASLVGDIGRAVQSTLEHLRSLGNGIEQYQHPGGSP